MKLTDTNGKLRYEINETSESNVSNGWCFETDIQIGELGKNHAELFAAFRSEGFENLGPLTAVQVDADLNWCSDLLYE